VADRNLASLESLAIRFGRLLPGFSRPLDCDRFNGDNADFLKWMGPPPGSA
jgi:hypothetical protein